MKIALPSPRTPRPIVMAEHQDQIVEMVRALEPVG